VNSIGHKTDQFDSPNQMPCHLLPVVGIGASAGGLEALEAFFSHLPTYSGFAFIVVTHQLPEHVSLLPDLLKRFTTMPVLTAEDSMVLEKNQVFVCPPGKNLALFKHRLQLMESTRHQAIHLPIDYFFRSLAEDIQEMAIGIIRRDSGSGS
jgi:two-component system CheB/CheR fusion protein